MRRSDIFTNDKALPATQIMKIIRNWADTYVMPARRQYDEAWDSEELIEHALKVLMVDLGLQKAFIPAEYGGWGSGNIDNLGTFSVLTFEEIGRADPGIAIAFAAGFWPLLMIAAKPHINKKLCAEFSKMYVDSDKPVCGGLFMTEPQGGSDIENVDLLHGRTMRTTAVLDGEEWVINGHKLWPSNSGGVADMIGLVCTTNPGSDNDDDIAFIFVPADTPGVTQGKPYEKAGLSADKNGDVWFENVRVPKWYRAWGPGLDALYFKEIMALGMLTAAFSTGAMLDVYETLYDFCSKKTLNGRPLKEHDAIAAELSEIACGIEVSRIALYRLAEILDRPDLYGPRWSPEILAKARLIKMFVSDRTVRDCERAMEILGTYGADREWDIEKHWRDIKIVQLWEGGKQTCQMDVARVFFDCETL